MRRGAPRSGSNAGTVFARVLGLTALCALLALIPANALASTGHRYSSQFGGQGAGDGDLSGPTGLAINQTSGDVHVLDAGNNRIENFDASGDYLSQISGALTPAGTFSGPQGLALDGADGSLYVADTGNGVVEKFTSAGALDTSFGDSGPNGALAGTAAPQPNGAFSPAGVAVDGSGNLYVADQTNNAIDIFDDTGTYQSQIDLSVTPANSPTGVGVNAAATAIYVVGSGLLERFNAAGTDLGTIDPSGVSGVSVDPSSGDVYVADQGPQGAQVSEYDSSDTFVSAFGGGKISSTNALGVKSSSGKVYVADNPTSSVLTFRLITLPTLTADAATSVDASSATINGSINPENVPGTTSYHFDWGTDTNYGTSTDETVAAPGGSPQPVSADLDGQLQPNTAYHYRVVATNPAGSISSSDQTFTTDQLPPVVDGSPPSASNLSSATATLNATVNPEGTDAAFHFDYVDDAQFQIDGFASATATAPGDAGAGIGDTPVTTDVSTLDPTTTYHFRVVADNGVGGPVAGSEATFTTAAATTAQTDAAADIHPTTATFNGSIDTDGVPTTIHFDYVTDAQFQIDGFASASSTSEVSAADGPVSQPSGFLTQGTLYHYRLLATNSAGPVSATEQTFTTPLNPLATLGATTAITINSATFHGTADVQGLSGTYSFQVQSLSETAFSASTPDTSVPAGAGPQDVSATLDGLPGGNTFSVSLEVTTPTGTVATDFGSFSTLPVPPPTEPQLPPPPFDDSHIYGCTAPHLNAIAGVYKPGQSVAVSGTDFGFAGELSVAGARTPADTYSQTAISFTVPAGLSGTVAMVLHCGTDSNAVALVVQKKGKGHHRKHRKHRHKHHRSSK